MFVLYQFFDSGKLKFRKCDRKILENAKIFALFCRICVIIFSVKLYSAASRQKCSYTEVNDYGSNV